MSTYRALIMDFDGVIIESNTIKTNAFHEVFMKFPNFTEEMMIFHKANEFVSRYTKFDYLLELLGQSNNKALRADIAKDFSKRVMKDMTTVPFVSGALYFLETVYSRIPVYLSSITPENELICILKQLKIYNYFTGLYGCPPWSKSDAIKDILFKTGLKHEQVLLIGDSAGDQRAAKETGINFFGRDSGLRFDEPKPRCFSNLDELILYLNETQLI